MYRREGGGGSRMWGVPDPQNTVLTVKWSQNIPSVSFASPLQALEDQYPRCRTLNLFEEALVLCCPIVTMIPSKSVFTSDSSGTQMGTSTDDFLGAYEIADLTADMNALTFAERQAIEEEIHGVADVIEETPEFVARKIEAMEYFLTKLDNTQRQAMDRAFFLRPALSEDRRYHLMCLRASQFRPDAAAVLMAKYFKAKRDFFGDDLLIHRITWKDVSNSVCCHGRAPD